MSKRFSQTEYVYRQYLTMDGLALEARQKFNDIRPRTVGQASRISGVNPSDISILLFIRFSFQHFKFFY